LGYWTRSIPLY